MEPLQHADPQRIGTYTVLARLGQGGMGSVFLGRSAAGRLVAIKVVHTALAGDPDFRSRFRREVVAARAVSGAFTAPLIDADPEADRPWLVTAFLPGLSLDEAVAVHGALPVSAVRALAVGLAEAVASIHGAGVVHRDLKPSNVMLTLDGPRVIDFGIARAAEVSAVTRSGVVVGTPGYMAPEQAAGGEAGPAGDVFSLGGVLVFAATGHPPFGEGQIHSLVYRVLHEPPRLDGLTDPGVRALVSACLDKDPALRPAPRELLRRLATEPAGQDASGPYGTGWLPPAVAADLDRRADTSPPAPATLPAPPPGGSGMSRRRLLTLVGAGAGANVLAVGGAATGATALLLNRYRHSGPPWTYHPPKSVYRGPVVAGAQVYVSDLDGHLLAIDAHSGRPRWMAPIASDRSFALTVTGNIGYLTKGGELTAFDPGTGRTLWQRSAETTGLYSTPSVSSGLAYLGSSPRSSPGGYLLTAYDARTGEPRWKYEIPARVGGDLSLGPGLVHVGGDDGILRALDAARGGLRWQQSLGAPIRSTAKAAGGSVLVTTDDHGIVAVDAATGRSRWRAHPGRYNGVFGSLLTIREATVFFREPGRLYAHDLADGRLRWQRDLGGGMPVTAGGMAFLTAGKTLYGLGLADGVPRWQQVTEGEAKALVLAGGAVHVLTFSGVRSYAPATGRLLRRKEGLLLSDGLTTDGTTIYFASDYDIVYALPGRP